MDFAHWYRRAARRLPATDDVQAKQEADEHFQNDARALREMIRGRSMVKCADSAGRFVPQLKLGDRALKTR